MQALTEQNTPLFYILLGTEECIHAETRQSHLSSPIGVSVLSCFYIILL